MIRPRLPASRTWLLSSGACGIWLLLVAVGGQLGRVLDHWVSAVTMLAGSFLTGSSPAGGSAVAFPVFTKGLDVPPEVARTFGLAIQSVGMTMAVVAIVLARRPVHLRAAAVGSVAGIVGFAVSVLVLTDREAAFRPSSIATPWVKATFSIVLATTAVMMVRQFLRHRQPDATAAPDPSGQAWTRDHDIGVAAAGLAGGLLSSMTGTGANILVFLFLVVVVAASPKVALPTAIVVMTAISIVGFVWLGLIGGQFDLEILDGRVVAAGGIATDLSTDQGDLVGLWLAAVPVVVWGAPLGSWAAARVREQQFVAFVAFLATVEVVTTVVVVPEIGTDATLLAYLVVGIVALPALFIGLRHRFRPGAPILS